MFNSLTRLHDREVCYPLLLSGLGWYTIREVRQVEVLLPDHQVIVDGGYDIQARLQALLDARQDWITQPHSRERNQALKAITTELRELGRRNSTT